MSWPCVSKVPGSILLSTLLICSMHLQVAFSGYCSVIASQLDLLSLMPLSIAGCGRLQSAARGFLWCNINALLYAWPSSYSIDICNVIPLELYTHLMCSPTNFSGKMNTWGHCCDALIQNHINALMHVIFNARLCSSRTALTCVIWYITLGTWYRLDEQPSPSKFIEQEEHIWT